MTSKLSLEIMRAVSYNTAFQTRVGVQVEWVIGIRHGPVSYIYEWVKGDTHTQLCISDMNDYVLNLWFANYCEKSAMHSSLQLVDP